MPVPMFTTTVVSNAADDDSVAASQTPAGAGNLTLTSSTVTFGSSAAQRITITSSSNISNRTFTITGTDVYGNSASFTLTGPNNTTVTSTLALASVTQVAISGAAAGALSVGNSAFAEGCMFPCNVGASPFSIGFGCIITGTPTYTVQHTFDNVLSSYTYTSTSNTWFNHPTVASATANADGNYAFPVSAIKLTLSAAGTVVMKLNQSGMGAV